MCTPHASFSHLCTAHGRVVRHAWACPFPKNCPFAWTTSNKWFLGPTWILYPNGITVGWSVFAGLTTVRNTDHATQSVTIGRIYVHSTAMRPNKQLLTECTLTVSQRSTHPAWNWCMHWSTRSRSPSLYSLMQMLHSGTDSPPWSSLEEKDFVGSLSISLGSRPRDTSPMFSIRLIRCWNNNKQQLQPFYGPLSGTTRVSRYQKKHSPTYLSWSSSNILSASSIDYDP